LLVSTTPFSPPSVKRIFAGREIDLDVGVERFFEQLAQFGHAFARHDHIGHALGAIGA
jgi:hypothetical protein